MMKTTLSMVSAAWLSMGGMAEASCPAPFMNDQFEPIAFPGDANYDPQTYARELYARFEYAFQSPSRLVVIASLRPLWDIDVSLPHEQHFTDYAAYESYGPLFHDLVYEYARAYEISGVEVTATGAVPLTMEHAGLRIRLGEGYAPRPFSSEEPAMFEVANERWRVYVEGAVCFETTWPAPTSEALDVVIECIANEGCAE